MSPPARICAREVPVVVPVVVDRGGGSGGEGVVVMPRHLRLAFARGRCQWWCRWWWMAVVVAVGEGVEVVMPCGWAGEDAGVGGCRPRRV